MKFFETGMAVCDGTTHNGPHTNPKRRRHYSSVILTIIIELCRLIATVKWLGVVSFLKWASCT